MQNRFLLALILSMVVMLAWSQFFAPKRPAKKPEQETAKESTEPATSRPAGMTEGAPNPQVDAPAQPQAPGGVDQLPDAEPYSGQLFIQNDKLRIAFGQKGGVVETVWLLEHWEHVADKGTAGYENKLRFIRSYAGGPRAFELTDGSIDGVDAGWLNSRLWATTGTSADGKSIEFTTEVVQNGRRIRLIRSYAFHPTAPHRIEAKLAMVLLEGEEGGFEKTFWINTSGGVFPEERSDGTNKFGLSLSHVQVGSRPEKKLELVQFKASDILEDKNGLEPSGVFGCDMGVYFGAYLRPVGSVGKVGVRVRAIDPFTAAGITKPSRADLERVGPVRAYSQVAMGLNAAKIGDRAEVAFDWYVGPKDHRSIKNDFAESEVARDDYLDVADAELTAQGSFCCVNSVLGPVIQIISKAVVWLISFFTSLFGSAGIAIIVLTICVRVLMFPITRKSQVSMQMHAKKMAKIKPKLEALKEKYKNDQQKFASEQMKMMKSEGVSLLPLGGCLPLFLQIPVFFGLFSAIRFDYELRHAAFLWCPDLSMPDTVLAINPIALPCFCTGGAAINGLNVFPLLMIAAMFFHQLGMPKSPDPQMQQQQKIMMFMPILFGVMMYGYAAGLSVYWLSSSLFGIFEQRVIKKLFPIDKDDDAVTPVKS